MQSSLPSASELVRSPAVAGRFYPDDPATLRSLIEGLLADARDSGPPQYARAEVQPRAEKPPTAHDVPKALIVPHAGYAYSGEIAARGFAQLTPFADHYRRVLLIGPAHRVAIRGLAASSASSWKTPLGDVPVDQGAIDELVAAGHVTRLDEAHRLEHCLEVEVPFLQCTLGDFQIVPLLAGECTAEQVGNVLEFFWSDPGTLVVISSDLSHYHDSEAAREVDRHTADCILEGAVDELRPEDACGFRGIQGLLVELRRRAGRIVLLDLRNSGDTAGSADRVVGYGAFVVYAGTESDFTDHEQDWLLTTACNAVRSVAHVGRRPPCVWDAVPPRLMQVGHSFVTLKKSGELRGCIGSLEPTQFLLEDVALNAASAACRDPRFYPVRPDELPEMSVTVSVLSPPQPISFENEVDLLRQLRPGIDGLTLRMGSRRATFLPSVWDHVPDPAEFLGRLKEKLGAARDFWSNDLRAERYRTVSFSRPIENHP